MAIEQGTFHELGSLILDELHMVGDAQRGYLMEVAATKTIAMQQNVQIIGMSATLSVRSYRQERITLVSIAAYNS